MIDFREPREHEASNIGGVLIPLATIAANADRISKEGKVVVYCHSGLRSVTAVRELEAKFGFGNLYNLKGGIVRY